jgi:hypothetical protein
MRDVITDSDHGVIRHAQVRLGMSLARAHYDMRQHSDMA